jgi:hypothetical protein
MLGSFLCGFQFDTGRGLHRGAGFTTPAGHDKAGVNTHKDIERRPAIHDSAEHGSQPSRWMNAPRGTSRSRELAVAQFERDPVQSILLAAGRRCARAALKSCGSFEQHPDLATFPTFIRLNAELVAYRT